MKNHAKVLLLACLILASCSPEKIPTPTATASNTIVSLQQATDTSISHASSTHTPVASPTLTPTKTPLPAGLPEISAPEGWYTTRLDVDHLHAVALTYHNPEDESFTSASVFPVAALVTTPLADGSDPEALQAGLAANLDAYGSSDLEGMLLPAQQIGLIDLLSVEEVVLSEARLDSLAGMPALLLDGMITLGGNEIRVQVWLSWTQEIFMAYYQFAQNENWQIYAASLDAARNSIYFAEIE